MPTHVIPVILCGGSGTRLWPASREEFPKQFLAFGGDRSLFQATIARLAGKAKAEILFERPIVVSNQAYRSLVVEQLASIGVQADIVLEPLKRDSAAAIAAAAHLAMQRNSAALVLVLAADHAIPQPEAFLDHVLQAAPAAKRGRIVTFGLAPSHAATLYGYIKPGAPVTQGQGVCEVERFVEKPDAATASRYLQEGYLWNSGNLLFAPDCLLEELKKHAPEICGPAVNAAQRATQGAGFILLEKEAFGEARAAAIDYALLEKTELVAVLPSAFVWSDVGSWQALHELASRDEQGNAVFGKAYLSNARNSLVYSPHGLTAVVGLSGIAVISMPDIVLVAPLSMSDEIKVLVEKVKAEGLLPLNNNSRQVYVWGTIESLVATPAYVMSLITVMPRSRCELPAQVQAQTQFTVLAGTAAFSGGQTPVTLKAGDNTEYRLGQKPVIENASPDMLNIACLQFIASA